MKKAFLPQAILLLVLFAGVFLRAYDWMAIPFTHDEYSALFRTGYDTFGELIEKGVANDVHPAGVQVFLNYWIALVGDQPYLVKLPFLVCGLGSIFLTYRIGAFWFHQTTGITAAALVASIQPMVMYSQIARPYMSGVLLVLLAVWYLSQYLTKPYHSWGSYTGWILAATAAAYNHYFSLLTVAVIGLLGLLLTPKHHLKSYLLSGLLIIAAFLPHLPITLQHLQQGSLGWLPPPGNTFFPEFLNYTTNHSLLIQVIWGLLLLLGLWFHFYHRGGETYQVRNFRYLLIGAIVIPAIVGFWYSKSVGPVLQFSSLVFGLPLFLLASTSFLPPFSSRWLLGLTILLLGANSYTLINERHHYKLLYNNRYKASKVNITNDMKHYGEHKLSAWLTMNKKVLNRWKEQHPVFQSKAIHNLSGYPLKRFKDTLRGTGKPYLAMAFPEEMNWTAFRMAKELYPYVLKVKNWHLGRYFLMARKPHPDTIEVFKKSLRPTSLQGNAIAQVPTGERYGPSIEKELKGQLANPNDVLLASAYVKKTVPEAVPQIGLSLHKAGVDTALHWKGGRPLKQADTNWQQVVAHISLARKPWDLQKLKVKSGVWDPKAKGFKAKQVEVNIIRGNRWVYGLRHPIPEPYSK